VSREVKPVPTNGALAALGAWALLAIGGAPFGCATARASKDSAYLRGMEAFRAGRCAEAYDDLVAYQRSSCSSGTPGAGCQYAMWMKVQCDLMNDRPARAIVDSDLSETRGGPPRPELDPPLHALREQALSALSARWQTPDRSVTLTTTFRDETGGRYLLESLSIAVDLQPALHPLPTSQESTVLQASLPPGDHFVRLAAQFSGNVRGGRFKVTLRSAQSFLSKPGETICVSARAYLRDALPLEAAPDLLAIGFDVTPASAKP
jgi:hypothetical protein